MNPRNTLLLAIVTALIGGFVYFYEIEGGAERDQAEEDASRLFPGVNDDAIQWIELVTSDGQKARVERVKGGWQMREPLDFPADEVALDGLARAAATLKFEREFENPEGPGTYGLEKQPTLRFGTEDAEHGVVIGDAAPVGGTTYIATADGTRTFAAQSFEVTPFEKDLKSLRDRNILRFARDEIVGVAIEWPDQSAKLRKVEDKWVMAEPIVAPGDFDAVGSLLSQVEFMRAADFVDEPGAAERETLASPALRITLEKTEGEARTLEIGELVGERRLIRVDGGERLFSVPHGVIDDFPDKVVSLRYRELGRFSAVEAKAFELTLSDPSGGDALQVAADRDAGSWKATPAMAEGAASRMMSTLAGLEADEVEAEKLDEGALTELGLVPPRVSIRILGEEEEGARSELVRIEMGTTDPERGIVARVAGENTIYRVAYDIAENVPLSAEAFQNRFVATEEDAEAENEAASEEDAGAADETAADETAEDETAAD